jgi:hypothetical protein
VEEQEPDNLLAGDEPFAEFDDEPEGPSWAFRVVIIITVIAMVLTVSWWIVLPAE